MVHERWQEHGLTAEEYETIQDLMGRKPNDLELALFGVMWSEHCSYKSSRLELKQLPQRGDRVLQGPGENAGVVDIGDGYACVFKIESHNHPSAIEPYQGAATGVGGIIRDIFAMGARPVALLNSLRFGSVHHDRVRYLLQGVVKGIGDYGNCMGIPTVGGELYFSPSYEDNPLVNAMCVGIVKKENLTRAQAAEEGNPVMIIGARTGRDGIQGASFASHELSSASQEDRPSVQVGDPFMEKLLLEACLELIDQKLIEGLQDLGAAGLTSSTSEVASRSGLGMEVDVLKVPRREKNMTPYEIMLSESQERMLLIPAPGCIGAIQEVLERWGLEGVVIGRMIRESNLIIKEGEEEKACIPVAFLVDEAPAYRRTAQPLSPCKKQSLPQARGDVREEFLALIQSPNLCSRAWIYEQYDSMVGNNTVLGPGKGGALIRISDTEKGLAISCDGNSRYCALDPYWGGALAVAEGCRNVIARGAEPLAITDGLNFGNPEKPTIYAQFKEVLRGMTEACKALNTPVISGNVSFYNETHGQGIDPTPIIGTVGLLENLSQRVEAGFRDEGDCILLLGETREDFGGSEYLSFLYDEAGGCPPGLNLKEESRLHKAFIQAAKASLLKSAEDLSEGGLALALMEMVQVRSLGAQLNIEEQNLRRLLFSETPSRLLCTTAPDKKELVLDHFLSQGVPCTVLGLVQGDSLDFKGLFHIPVKELESAWRGVLPSIMNK